MLTGRPWATWDIWILYQKPTILWLHGKDSDAGRDWGQEEKGTTEEEKGMTKDEIAGWHH